jgi:hypothetical protein
MDIREQLIVFGLFITIAIGLCFIIYIIKRIIDFKGEAVKLPYYKPGKPEEWI